MGFEQPGGFVAQVPLHEMRKQIESEGDNEYGLNKAQEAQLLRILDVVAGISEMQWLKNRLEDVKEFPEDFPEYDGERAERLLAHLRDFDAHSAEFRESSETIAKMLKSNL
jgi:hypothetical protein